MDGWITIGLTAAAGYEVYEARKDVRNAYADWKSYYDSPNWNYDTDRLYFRIYENAKSSEDVTWRALLGAGIATLAQLNKAVSACAPVAGAPVP